MAKTQTPAEEAVEVAVAPEATLASVEVKSVDVETFVPATAETVIETAGFVIEDNTEVEDAPEAPVEVEVVERGNGMVQENYK